MKWLSDFANWITPVPEVRMAAGQKRDATMVPAGVGITQINDYVRATGETWPFDMYFPRLTVSRNTAISYSTMFRCVSLLSGAIAQICTDRLRVIDREDREQSSPAIDRALELMGWSPDGTRGAFAFHEDAVTDYCLDGNALLTADVLGNLPVRLRRFSSWDHDTTRASDGTLVFRLSPVDSNVVTERLAERDIIHVRWGRMQKWERGQNSREPFALAPVTAMRTALGVGLQGDKYVLDYFESGARSKLHINFKTPPGQEDYSPEQRKDLAKWVEKGTESRDPLVTFDADSSLLQDTPQDKNAAALRDFQVGEIARVYGIPSAVIGSTATEWGTAIAELARYWWKFGLSVHLERYLEPFSMRLLPKGLRFKGDNTALLRGDAEAISKLLMATQGDAQRAPVATWAERRDFAGLLNIGEQPPKDLMVPVAGTPKEI